MVELTDNEKRLLQQGKSYREKNNVDKFDRLLSTSAQQEEIGHISEFFLENNINIFDYFTVLPNYAFYNSGVEEIVLPDNIVRIGKEAFKGCKKLRSIDLGNSIKSIDSQAFAECTNLNSVYLPDSLTILGSNIFKDCSENLVLIANKRTGSNRLRCKQDDKEWYKKHLILNNSDDEGENI